MGEIYFHARPITLYIQKKLFLRVSLVQPFHCEGACVCAACLKSSLLRGLFFNNRGLMLLFMEILK